MPDSDNGVASEGFRILNQNVLIEIGAAMALFDDRFILLVENETELPSNSSMRLSMELGLGRYVANAS